MIYGICLFKVDDEESSSSLVYTPCQEKPKTSDKCYKTSSDRTSDSSSYKASDTSGKSSNKRRKISLSSSSSDDSDSGMKRNDIHLNIPTRTIV